jgi:hypothetical protein
MEEYTKTQKLQELSNQRIELLWQIELSRILNGSSLNTHVNMLYQRCVELQNKIEELR